MKALQHAGCNHFDHACLYTNSNNASNNVPQSLLKILYIPLLKGYTNDCSIRVFSLQVYACLERAEISI